MIRQRTRQFFGHDVAPGPADEKLAGHYLEAPLLELFLGQESRDVVHAANTARWLLDRGHDDRELIRAALLHDIGKGEQRRRDRVAHVIAAATGIGGVVADPQSTIEMRRAVARSRLHAATGAEILQDYGVAPRLVELVKNHHSDPGRDAMLKLLQEADSAT